MYDTACDEWEKDAWDAVVGVLGGEDDGMPGKGGAIGI